MRARVELVIRDEEGNILSQLDPYLMELGSQSLHDIEAAVENWRQQALADIEHSSATHSPASLAGRG